jgi:hypothetical protein
MHRNPDEIKLENLPCFEDNSIRDIKAYHGMAQGI